MKYEVFKDYTTAWVMQNEECMSSPRYQVILENDDFTPMEFVMKVLERFFFMDRNQAADVMFKAHVNGRAACGLYTKEVAETKIAQCVEYARRHDHPLELSMEGA